MLPALESEYGVLAGPEVYSRIPALDEILAGKPVSVPETKQYGCSVKYKD